MGFRAEAPCWARALIRSVRSTTSMLVTTNEVARMSIYGARRINTTWWETQHGSRRNAQGQKGVLVTGASGGLGAHFAQVAARHGARVVIGARRKGKLGCAGLS